MDVEPSMASPSCSRNIFSWSKYFWFCVRPVGITISHLSCEWVGFGFYVTYSHPQAYTVPQYVICTQMQYTGSSKMMDFVSRYNNFHEKEDTDTGFPGTWSLTQEFS
jgi:hypothetical protein